MRLLVANSNTFTGVTDRLLVTRNATARFSAGLPRAR